MAFACIQINAFYGLAANVCPVYCSGIKWCGKVIKAREGKELVDQVRGAVYAMLNIAYALLLDIVQIG
jgi:hypothetical protein